MYYDIWFKFQADFIFYFLAFVRKRCYSRTKGIIDSVTTGNICVFPVARVGTD